MDPSAEHSKPQEHWGEVTFSRRLFLGGVLVGGTSLALGVISRPEVLDIIDEKRDRMSYLDRIRSESLADRKAGIRTAVESVVMWAGNMVVGNLANHLQIPRGAHAAEGEVYEEQISNAPLQTYFKNNVAIPVVEEAIFRMLPSAFYAEEVAPNIKLHWQTGLAANLAFGAIHNVSRPTSDTIRIHLNSLPLEQLILGAYCWYAQRTGGFLHAAGAHVLYNNLCSLYPYSADEAKATKS